MTLLNTPSTAAASGVPNPPKRTLTYNQLTSCPDMEAEFLPIYAAAKPYTLTSLERMHGLYKAVEQVIADRVPGDFVECGVWKGGSAMVAALSFLHFGDTTRKFWLYDTYEGMADPGEHDIQYDNLTATQRLEKDGILDRGWRAVANAGEVEVRTNLASTHYPMDKCQLVRGLVEETLPHTKPTQISILRLDTDWYESTKVEMEELYPLLSPGGILILDDYGHWKGSRKAVDEYFAAKNIQMYLARLDYACRIGVKPYRSGK